MCYTIRSFWWRILVASISDSYYHNGTKAKPCNCVFCGVGLRKFMKAFDAHRSYFHVWVFTNLSYLNLICNQIFLRCFDIHIVQHLIEVFQNWLFWSLKYCKHFFTWDFLYSLKVWRMNKNTQIVNLFISQNFLLHFFNVIHTIFLYNPINVKRPIGDISDVPRFLEKKMSHYFSRQL